MLKNNYPKKYSYILLNCVLLLFLAVNSFSQTTVTVYQDKFDGTINTDVPDAVLSKCNNCRYQNNIGGLLPFSGTAYFYLNNSDGIDGQGVVFDRALTGANALIPGVTYSLSVKYATAVAPAGNYTFSVVSGGSTLGSVTKTDFAIGSWKTATFNFTAAATNNVQFYSNDPGYWNGYDQGFEDLTITHTGPSGITISNSAVCPSLSTTFTSSVTTMPSYYTSPVYQWQQSTDSGTTWTNIAGATNPTYTIPNVDSTYNNRRYRLVIAQNAAAMSAGGVYRFVSNTINLGTTSCAGIKIKKTSNGGFGTFAFSKTNANTNINLTTTASGPSGSATSQTLPISSLSSSTVLTETGYTVGTTVYVLAAVNCVNSQGNPVTPSSVNLATRTVTFNANTISAGTNITCEFVNSGPPNISLVKACTVPSDCVTKPQLPGTELTYKIDFTNTGGLSAANLAIVDAVPSNTDFKVGSASVFSGTTGLAFVIEYSNNYSSASPASATWNYTPVSGGGGASSGYDRNVTAIRWRVTSGSLSSVSPANTGYVSFQSKIR